MPRFQLLLIHSHSPQMLQQHIEPTGKGGDYKDLSRLMYLMLPNLLRSCHKVSYEVWTCSLGTKQIGIGFVVLDPDSGQMFVRQC